MFNTLFTYCNVARADHPVSAIGLVMLSLMRSVEGLFIGIFSVISLALICVSSMVGPTIPTILLQPSFTQWLTARGSTKDGISLFLH